MEGQTTKIEMTAKRTALEIVWDLMERLVAEGSITMWQYHELDKICLYIWKQPGR